jgi:hypothetical protein
MEKVAFFVSPHGFGHAARACAVMAALLRRRSELHFEIFTEVPEWFFAESLVADFTYHRFDSDVGLVQVSSLDEDLAATIRRLDRAPYRDSRAIDTLAKRLQELDCTLVVVDISPLGLAAAHRAGLPSVLVENFTWDWIYANYPGAPPTLVEHGRRMAPIFARADLRIQTEPVCDAVAGAAAVAPVARLSRRLRTDVRKQLGVPSSDPMVLLSMGGVQWDSSALAGADHRHGPWVVVPGGSACGTRRQGRLLMLPFHADVFHPDLVAASDLVVGKLGYSTVAEVYRAGSAFAFVRRPRFPESPVLARWAEGHLAATEIEEQALRRGDWLREIESLLAAGRPPAAGIDGAGDAAAAILGLLTGHRVRCSG